MESLASLMSRHARAGRVEWIGLRPARLVPMITPDGAEVTPEGLAGDRGRPGKRAITLMQAEHLPVIGALAAVDPPIPETLRRNILVAGINLNALRGRDVRIGTAVLCITGPCAPCSRMEAALGPGGYNAMRGHGGWCATVVSPGFIALGDAVSAAAPAA